MQKNQQELAMDFVNEVIETDYMDGVFCFLEQQNYDLLTSYSLDENNNELCTSKLAVIGNGLFTLINLPGNELFFYFGAVTWDEGSPFFGLTTNAELSCEEENIDESVIAYEYLKEALENHDVLEIHLLRIMAYFTNHSEYFLECSGDVMPGTYELTDHGLEEQFKKFINFLDTRVVPKLQFEREQEISILRDIVGKKAEEINAARTKHKLVKPVALSPKPKPYTDRNIEVMRGYLSNKTMAKLATHYNVSTPRIRQVIQKMYKLFISHLKCKNEFIQVGDLDKTRITEDLKAKFNDFLDNYEENIKELESDLSKMEIKFDQKLVVGELPKGDTFVASAYLSARTSHILQNFGYKTMNQVANLTQQELLSLPGLGKKSLKELQEYFEASQTHTK